MKDKKYLQITLDDIIEDATKDEKRLAYLKSLATDGEISFLELKRAYCLKYYAKMVPVAKEKKPTMWERIEAL